jgi:hypothetical protein
MQADTNVTLPTGTFKNAEMNKKYFTSLSEKQTYKFVEF